MAERLALGVIPGVGWSAEEIQTIARQAEEAGFDAIFAAEVNNDVMRPRNSWAPRPAASRWGPGSPTSICATRTSVRKALIADATDGRFVLGLGVSHPP